MYMCQYCKCGFHRDELSSHCSAACKLQVKKVPSRSSYERYCFICKEDWYEAGMYNDEVCKRCAIDVGEEYFKKIEIKDYYVYEYLDHNKVFYVGKGKGIRAHVPHHVDVEHVRKRTQEFYIRIVEHGMSENDAYFLESKLIKLRKMEGYPLLNGASYRTRHTFEPEELFFTF